MSNLHPIFAQALRQFSPPPADDVADQKEQSLFADDREDIGYETARQRRIDNEQTFDEKVDVNLTRALSSVYANTDVAARFVAEELRAMAQGARA